MKFLRSTLSSFINNVFGVFLSFLTIVVTARILGPSGNGIWGVSTVVISLSVIIFGFGIPSSNVFFIGRNRKDINSVLGVNFLVMLVSAVCITVVYFINLKFHFKFFRGMDSLTLIIVFVTIPFSIIKASLYYVYLGVEKVTKYNKINMLDKFVTFVLLYVFVFAFRSAKWVIVSNFLSVIFMIGFVSCQLFIKDGYRISFNKELLKEMLKYGSKVQVGNLVQNINYRLDVLITATYCTPADVGLYGKATQLGETMWKVSGSVGTVVLPYSANSKDRNAMTSFLNKVTRITFGIIIVCALILTAICKPLILFVLGKNYAGSVMPFILIIPGICVFSINNILGNYFAGIGQVEKNVIASTISSVITVVLDLTLIPKIGINGASITSSISYTVCTIIVLYFYIKQTGSKLSDVLIIKKSDLDEIKLRLYQFKKVKEV